MNALVHPRAAIEPVLPLVEELTPTPEPWDVVRKLARQRGLLFLDSAATDSPHGRFSFVTADPFDWIESAAGCSAMPANPPAADPLQLLGGRLGRFRAETLAGLPPFQGGAAGLFGYDLCHLLERLPRPRHDEF